MSAWDFYGIDSNLKINSNDLFERGVKKAMPKFDSLEWVKSCICSHPVEEVHASAPS